MPEPFKTPVLPAPQRLARLDGLRGLAACGVAFTYHTQGLFAPGAFANAPAPVLWFHAWGWTFVDLFFVISGYIFAHVYCDGALQKPGSRADFTVARIARLYPLHLLTLIACGLLFWTDPANTGFSLLANLTMLQGFLGPDTRGFNGPSWSISIEVVCYALFAFAAASGPRALRLTIFGAIAVAIAQLVLTGKPGGPWTGDALSRGLLGFFFGQALWHWRDRLARAPAPLLAGVLVLGLWIDTGSWSSLLPFSLLAWPAALLLALRLPVMESRPLLWLGARSYAIYLVHEPVLRALKASQGLYAGPGWAVFLVHALFAVAVLALADLSLRFLEDPARKAIRVAWARRRQRAAPHLAPRA